MIKLKQTVIVEGRYDKAKLSSILDAPILETGGFRIYKDKERLELIRTVAQKTGIIILTDSDTAGFQIRSFLSGAIDPALVTHVYIPDVYGKEHRKEKPSAEGKLGVEGIPKEVLLKAFERAGVLCEESEPAQAQRRKISKTDLYLAGLSGRENSVARKAALLKKLDLPEHLSSNSLVSMLNVMFTYEEFIQIVANFDEK